MSENMSVQPEWWQKRNKRRRERYQNDPEYRRKQIEASRAKAQGRNSCLSNLRKLKKMGSNRETSEGSLIHCFTLAEVAEAINRKRKAVVKYIERGLWPEPLIDVTIPRRGVVKVYTYDQVEALVTVYGNHMKNTSYYTVHHAATKDEIFAAFEEVSK